MLDKILKEPLLHFALIGACLFGVYALVNPQAMQSDKKIVIDQGQINSLSERFSRVWKRAPTQDELNSLIEDFVVEEIYYREALAMGIDRDDPVIRRRLRQKMEVYTEDLVAALAPTDEQLDNYLQANPNKFSADSRYTLTQIYVSTDRSGDQLQAQLKQMQAALSEGKEPEGDTTLLPEKLEGYTATSIERTFGSGFSQQLDTLALNQWSKPLQSGLGFHFVMLTERDAGYLPELSAIRAEVEQQWRYDQLQSFNQRLRKNMVANYDVVVKARTEVN